MPDELETQWDFQTGDTELQGSLELHRPPSGKVAVTGLGPALAPTAKGAGSVNAPEHVGGGFVIRSKIPKEW